MSLNYKIRISSNFHEATAVVIARGNQAPTGVVARVGKEAMRRARKRICGHENCACSLILPEDWEWEADGSISKFLNC